MMCHVPGHKVTADIEENKEALVVGREGSVCTQAAPLLSQALQVDHVHVDLFSYGRRRHGVRNHAARRPSTAVHVQVSAPKIHTQHRHMHINPIICSIETLRICCKCK